MDDQDRRRQAWMLGHGVLVMIAGMVFGFVLGFSLLGAIDLWPIPALPVQLPGTPRGWAVAHAGCILNGLMVVAFALALPILGLSPSSARWVSGGLVATAWGNAIFYALAPIAKNRGLSLLGNRFGDASVTGALAFVPAMGAAVVVLVALSIAARAAFVRAAGDPS